MMFFDLPPGPAAALPGEAAPPPALIGAPRAPSTSAAPVTSSERASAGSAAGGSSFETFTLSPEEAPFIRPRPAPTRRKTAPGAERSRKRSRPRLPSHGEVRGRTIVTLFPGQTDVTLEATGLFQDRQFTSRFSPYRWFSGDFSDLGAWEYRAGNQALTMGNNASDLLIGASGLRWAHGDPARHTGRLMTGLGLYRSLGDPITGLPALAMDSHYQWRPGLTSGLLLATDRSWRFTQKLESRQGAAFLFGGFDQSRDRPEGGLLLQGGFDRHTSWRANLLGWSGDTQGQTLSLGLSRRIGDGVLTGTLTGTREAGLRERKQQYGSLGLFLPYRRFGLTLRLSQMTSEISGQDPRTRQRLHAGLSVPVDPRTRLWLGGGLVDRDSPYLSLGLGREFGKTWSLSGEIATPIGGIRTPVRAALGYRVDDATTLRLLVGPGSTVSGNGGLRTAYGLQVVRSFGASFTRAGRIEGRVFLDDKPYSLGKLPLDLDGEWAGETSAGGAFKLGKVAPGRHRLQLRLADLPAHVTAESSLAEVEVSRGKTAQVTFRLYRVGQVQGGVRVEPDEFGRTDPLAGVGIVVTAENGPQTTTGADTQFILGSLRPGVHRIRLAPETLPPDHEIVGEASREVRIEADRPAPALTFTIRPRPRAIEFSEPAN